MIRLLFLQVYNNILVILFSSICLTNSVLQQNCGTALTAGRIVGGYDVGFYKYPWFASLQLDGTAWCAGTLIGPSVVVSAAHCFKKPKKGKLEDIYKVKLGVYNNCATNEAYQKIYNVKKVYVHDEYYKQGPYFDISILVLDGDTSSYQPACVTTQVMNSSTRPLEALIQGLGDMKYDSGKYPCEVHEARILIYSDKDCEAMLEREEETNQLKHAFCAGYLEGGIDACQGDSGGPLVTRNSDSKYYLLGITSFGFECAAKDTLGIYTDVSHFVDWIEKKTNLKFTENQISTNETNATSASPGNPGNSTIIPPSFVTNAPPNVQVITANAGNGTLTGPIKITIEIKNKKKKSKKHGKRKYRNNSFQNYD